MHDAERVFARGMYGAVNRKAGGIDEVRRIHHLVAVWIDLHQTRRRDFVEHHAVGIEQKVMLSSWHARGNMREDQIVPAIERDQSISRREIDSGLPFSFCHLLADG